MIQRAAIHTNAHRLAVVHGHFANGRKLFITPLARAHISRIDPVLVQFLCAFGIFGQQHVPVVMKIADDRHVASGIAEAFFNLRNRRRRFRHVHRPAHNFRSRFRQFNGLLERRGHIRGVRVGHRLHHHRRAAAHMYVPHLHAIGLPAWMLAGGGVKTCDLRQHTLLF